MLGVMLGGLAVEESFRGRASTPTYAGVTGVTVVPEVGRIVGRKELVRTVRDKSGNLNHKEFVGSLWKRYKTDFSSTGSTSEDRQVCGSVGWFFCSMSLLSGVTGIWSLSWAGMFKKGNSYGLINAASWMGAPSWMLLRTTVFFLSETPPWGWFLRESVLKGERSHFRSTKDYLWKLCRVTSTALYWSKRANWENLDSMRRNKLCVNTRKPHPPGVDFVDQQ